MRHGAQGRGAARGLGFDKVYHYKAGTLDWLAAGLPTEGTNSDCPRAGDASRKDIVISGLKERLGDVLDRALAAGWNVVLVIDDQRVVRGLLRSKQLEMDPNLTAEQAMRPGSSTFRPYVSTKEMADFMVGHDLESAPITMSDGKLVGVLFREEAVRVAADRTACTRSLITTAVED